ncbi:MAG: hypothetical protein KDD33_04595, partial [Bdellovibrionales bacterium]|nr:hypothetical protein [Bdellovibrionales bacterium]
MKQTLLVLISILILPLTSQAQWNLFGSKKEIELKCESLNDIKKGFLIAHIHTSKMTPTLEARTIKQHLESFDPMKIYFSKQDVDSLQAKMKDIFKNVKAGNCKQLEDVQDFYIQRVKDRVAFAKKKLTPDFKFDKNIRIILDPDKRGWAKNKNDLQK